MTSRSETDGPFLVRVERACECGVDPLGSPCEACGTPVVVFLWAYETLEGVYGGVREIVRPRMQNAKGMVRATVFAQITRIDGPCSIDLPSGERITVEATTDERLAEEAGEPFFDAASRPRIVTAWNAEKGIGGGA